MRTRKSHSASSYACFSADGLPSQSRRLRSQSASCSALTKSPVWGLLCLLASLAACACSDDAPGGQATLPADSPNGAGTGGGDSGDSASVGGSSEAGSSSTGGQDSLPNGNGGAESVGGTPGSTPTGGKSSIGGGGDSQASSGGSDSEGGASAGGSTSTEGRSLGPAIANAGNPIVTHLFTADPSADSFEGRIYVYTSHDLDEQRGYDMNDYHAFSSDDLVNWQDHGAILEASNITWASKMFAPDCVYSEANDKYYLYFPDSGSGVGIAVSDSPGGPFEDALGKALVEKGVTPGIDDVDWVFDPSAFIDDDGQAYLYLGGGPSGDADGDNARVIKLGADMISTEGTAQTIKAPEFFEASFMHKREGKYYFSYSGDFRSHAAWIEYMVSDNPMTGFEYAGTVLKEPTDNNGDNNHHSIVEHQGSWYLFYHNRVLSNRLGGYSNYQRSITLDHLTYNDEGDINEVSTTRGEVLQLKAMDGLARMQAEMIAGEGGIETDWAVATDPHEGVCLTDLQDGDWTAYSQVDFGQGVTKMHARFASAGGASIEVLQGGCDGFRQESGTLAGSCEVPDSGGLQSWDDLECEVEIEAGVHDLCLRFVGDGQNLLNLDHFYFE